MRSGQFGLWFALMCAIVIATPPCPFSPRPTTLWEMHATDMPCAHSSQHQNDEWEELVEAHAAVKPDPGQKTFKGCSCTSSCGASITSSYSCDWCYTSDSCGRWGVTGYYDYCKYSPDSSFEPLTASEKMTYFWNEITKDKSRAAGYANVLTILSESIQTTFDNFAFKDSMPNGREKKIHSIGSICPFSMTVSADSKYTGLFQPGDVHGFIRMGSAADPVANKGITPGLGIKFPRTGHPSGNYVALHSLDLGQSWNFFAYNMSNHISPPSGATAILAKKFNQASQCAPQVGLSDMAKISQSGEVSDNPKTPFKLFMVPSAAVQTPAKEKTVDQIQQEMAAFPVGTVLYTVYACGSPSGDEMTPTDGGLEKACGQPLLLGDMRTTDQCTSSLYGDSKFHIRHQRVEEDWAIHPEFLTQYDAAKACGWSGKVSVSGVPKKCSAF